MQRGFWDKLDKPIITLAPMANVTDAAFRQILLKYGRPDVFWTEFVSVEALLSAGKGNALIDLQFSKRERPIVAQIFGSKPEQFTRAAKIIAKLGFDGIDINMGCPDRGVEKSGAGAALIKNSDLAKEIILATKKGVRSASSGQAGELPISVKTRIGYNSDVLEKWISNLAEAEPAAIILHLRTRREMSKVPARWEDIQRAKKILDKIPEDKRPLLIGNGDISSLKEAKKKAEKYKIDGVMIGRGLFNNFRLFSGREASEEERLKVLLEHTELFEKMYGGKERLKNFNNIKKFFKAYIHGFDGAKELRIQLMKAQNVKEVEKFVKNFK